MRSAFLALIVMTAGCAPLAPCPKCPPAKPAPETAVYLQFTFDGLPGWPSADLDRSLRTFLAGCPRSGALLFRGQFRALRARLVRRAGQRAHHRLLRADHRR